MNDKSKIVSAARFLKWPDDEADLPVLTDVIEEVTVPGEPTLWLAWDDSRVPVLNEVIEEAPIDPGTALVRLRPTGSGT
jgi:hypothetical protein